MTTPGIPPNISVPGVVGSIPSGYLLGRTSPGTGPVQLIKFSDIGSGASGTGKPAGGGSSFSLDSIGSTQGDILYRGATAWSALGPGTAGQILSTGGAGANPSWITNTVPVGANPTATIGTTAVNGTATTFMRSDAAPEFGNLTGDVTSVGMVTTLATVPITKGGTGQVTAAAAFNALSPITSLGDLIVGTGVNTAGRIAVGGMGTVLASNGTTPVWTTLAAAGLIPGTFTDFATAPVIPSASSFTLTMAGTAAAGTLTNMASGRGLLLKQPGLLTGSATFATLCFFATYNTAPNTTAFTLTGCFMLPGQVSVNSFNAGMFVADSTGKKVGLMWPNDFTATHEPSISYFTQVAAAGFMTLVASTTWTPATYARISQAQTPIWFKIQLTGGNLIFSFSLDGENYLAWNQTSATAFISTPASVGFEFQMSDNSRPYPDITMDCFSWQLTTP